MKKHLPLLCSFVVFLCSLAFAQPKDSSGVTKAAPDTLKPVSRITDSTARQSTTDSLRTAAQNATVKQLEGTNLKLIRRTYNSRQQILLATGMMVFVVAMVTAAQQWNPN
jgi:hypothetical protein